MLNITSYSVEMIKDPFQILSGKRYEFILDIEVEEEDELYSENGVYIRAVYSTEEGRAGIVKYDIRERGTDKYLEFDLEDEEERELAAFCGERWQEAEQ